MRARAAASLRDRLDEPFERATELTRKTLAWFPVRVWRHFLQHNGFLLAAAISYQSLFSIFAVIYAGGAVVGIWLGGSAAAIDGLIAIVNSYIPGLIGEDGQKGLISGAEVAAIAQGSAGVLAVTGAVALAVTVWTAIGFVTFTRRAIRDIFGLPFDSRSYVLLKARDLLAALMFGAALVIGAILATLASGAVELLFHMLAWQISSAWVSVAGRVASVIVGFAINTVALATLIRFLTGTTLHWRLIWPGALLGGGALIVLQFGAGLLLSYTPANPLLATFSVFIGFLLWFRLAGIVILVAASWVAVSAADEDVPLVAPTEAERRATEHAALLTAARVRLRDAHLARRAAPWWRGWQAEQAIRRAEDDLVQVEASAPPPPRRSGLFD